MPVQDPVCKMEIDKDEAAAETTYRGNKYYFCSEECKESFDKRPEQFIGPHRKRAAGE